jgi:16S rRNA (guanine527-N7)-methyltransferase
MTEEEAHHWLRTNVDPTAIEKIEHFVAMVEAERHRQNLISPGSAAAIWARHVVDSAQLPRFATPSGLWCDIGTGAGFPGVIVAIMRGGVVLVEPRTKRADFLAYCVGELGIDAEVVRAKAEAASVRPASVISARAVASIEQLLTVAAGFSTTKTIYVLPRGRAGRDEIANAQRTWHGMFHVEQSVTDPLSTIVTITGVSRRCTASR